MESSELDNSLQAQPGLFDALAEPESPAGPPTPAQRWDRDATKRALDELFSLTRQYRSSAEFDKLLRFAARFHFYAPFNAMLVHVQMPGAQYVAPAHRWLKLYRRRVKANARPIVILQPMGPVLFVFDVSDTEPEADAPPLPEEVESPFAVRAGHVGGGLPRIIANAVRDGVRISEQQAGSQSAGSIQVAKPGRFLKFQVRVQPEPEFVQVPLRYELLVNSSFTPEAKYATIAHELAHLYCGHLGTPNDKWWPDRRGLPHETCEFEAESITWLLCERLGIENPSAKYLAGYLAHHGDVPAISLECVMKAAGLIEQMGCERLKPRKEKEQE